MIEVRTFDENDFLDMLPRMWEAEQEDIANTDPAMVEVAIMGLKAHPSYTMLHGGKAVAIFGVRVDGEIGEAWTWFTPDVRQCKAEFEKTLGEYLDLVVKDYGLSKVYCGVLKGYEHKMPWVKRLGFEETTPRHESEVRYELCPQ